MPVANKSIVAPSKLPAALAQLRDGPIGASLASGKNVAVLLGNFAQQHPQAAQIHALAQPLAESLGARLGFLGEAANSVGGYLAGLPWRGERARDARAARARPTCCSAPSRSSTAPTRRPRGPRCSRPSSSSP